MNNQLQIKDFTTICQANSIQGGQTAFSFNLLNPSIMPTITMCEGNNANAICPIRELCYRFKAKPDPNYQAWFAYLPYSFKTESCECFMPAEKSRKYKPFGWLSIKSRL